MAEGTIVTFYSYKGGVGRTFALANVGVALANWGYKVLCIDWDLEAPGLKNYFDKWATPQKGLVELVDAIKENEVPYWHDFVTEVFISRDLRLDLIPAGREDGSYIDRVQKLDWVRMYEEQGLAERLEEWRTGWKQTYDFILLDSRTGVTDIGALCTAHLPDLLVVLFTANQQSIDGCNEVIERAVKTRNSLAFDRPALLVLPVPSRFDTRVEYERSQVWRDIFERQMGKHYQAWAERGANIADIISRSTIPYVPYWSFGEELPVIDETTRSTESIRFFLETIAALVAHRLSNSSDFLESSESYIKSAVRAGHLSEGYTYDIFLSSTKDQGKKSEELRRMLEQRGYSVFLDISGQTSDAELHDELERALSQSRDSVFLIGREHSPRIDIQLRRFAVQLLEDVTPRIILPITLYRSGTQNIPQLLRREQINVEEGTSLQSLADLILGRLSPKLNVKLEDAATAELKLALQRLEDTDPLAREASVNALKRIGSADAIVRLFDCLVDPDQRVKSAAKEAIVSLLGKIREGGNRLLEPLRPYMAVGDPDAQIDAAAVLASAGDTSAIHHLIGLLSNPDPAARTRAAQELGRLRAPLAIDWLVTRLSDSAEAVQIAAAHSLIGMGERRAIEGLFSRAGALSISIQRKLAGDLISLEHPFLHESLLNALKAYPSILALDLVWYLAPPEAKELIIPLLQIDNVDIRKAGIQTLAEVLNLEYSDKRILTIDFDGFYPWRDPKEPITTEIVNRAATILNLGPHEIRDKFISLNQALGNSLNLQFLKEDKSSN